MKNVEELTDTEKKMAILGIFCMVDYDCRKDILDRAIASSIESETEHISKGRSGLHLDSQELS